MSDNNETKYNPLSHSSIDKQLRDREEEKARLLREKELMEEYINAMNRLFASSDGKFFLNRLKRACGINSFDKELNPAKLVEDRGRRSIWFDLIQPHLDINILRELEQK